LGAGVDERHNVFHVPQAIRDTDGHRRGHAERLVHAAEIVKHEVERQGVNVVVDLAAERIREPRQ
jgi:hypothetical protein